MSSTSPSELSRASSPDGALSEARSCGALGRLLELEESILERLGRVREESEQSVARARAEAELAHEHLSEQLFEAVEELRLRVESEHRSELCEIRERARTEAEKLDSCDEIHIANLASALVELLLVSSTGSGTKG